ncbi:MAG: AI-2E family transporter [Actinobacteria bacterium]|nr:AI-2E family transporter [Actinomycetota bacterium]
MNVRDGSGLDGAPAERRRSRGRRWSDHARADGGLAATITLGVAGGLLLTGVVQFVFSRLQDLLVAVVVSLFLSFAMEPAVQWLSRRGMRRGLATALTFLAAGVALIGFIAAMAPLVVSQVRTLIGQGPEVLSGLADQARRLPAGLGDSIADYLEGAPLAGARASPAMQRLGGGILGFGTTVLGGVIQTLTILLVTFYLVADGPRLRRTLSSRLRADRQANFLAIWDLAIEKTGGYVYSRLLIAVASAAFHATAFIMIDVPYALALGAWVGVISSLIPVVGTYLAGSLPLAVALARDPIGALWVLLAVVVYQQFENYLVQPRVTAHTLALHPAVAFLAVLGGAALLGAAGALLALPAAAIIAALVSAAGARHEVMEHDLVEAHGVSRR